MHKKLLSLLFISLVLVQVSCGQEPGKKNSENQSDNPKKTENLNDLAKASSPYLQEHADNPVDWMEWGPEALKKAKEENKPLLISIGYSACHWCHVMEDESFMDTTVAKMMNEHFVPIKVDREERPDIDQVYMDAATMLNGQGGWPLNAFALPDGRPFFAGTYFPKDQWLQVLRQIANVYENKHDKVLEQAEALTEGIQKQELVNLESQQKDFTKEQYKNLFDTWEGRIDFAKGGFKGSPKFPMPSAWEFLLQNYYLTGNEKTLEAVTTTLDAMARGGIYDQIGGGFARYSTDDQWFAPHFEKMLYDNGQLISLYANAFKITNNPEYERVIRETLEFVERELQDKNGGFYSSLNADSEGEEGKFYVFQAKEIDEVLSEENEALIKEFYNVKKRGNWENDENILYREESEKEFAKENGLSEKQWDKQLKKAKEKLLAFREKRERPSTDDKILTSWNALMLKGYLDAYQALGDEDYLKIALKNARFLETNMIKRDGSLFRNFKDGKPAIDAFLDDYALLADAFLELYQSTFDKHWLDQSEKVAEYALQNFSDENEPLLFYTSNKAEKLIARKKEIMDNVIPASNSVFAMVIYKLGLLKDRSHFKEKSKKMLSAMGKSLDDNGPYAANWARLMGLEVYEPYEIAITGENYVEKRKKLQANFLPNSLFLGGNEENLALLKNKLVPGETIIYVCQNKVCQKPVEKVDEALRQVN